MESRTPKRPGSFGQKKSSGGTKGSPPFRSRGFQRTDNGDTGNRTNTRLGGGRPQSGQVRGKFGPGNRPAFRKPLDDKRGKGRVFGKGRTVDKQESARLVRLTSDLQISDGKFRGKLLFNSPSSAAVPTPLRLREIVFRNVYRQVRAGRFLDLCSGCGIVGIDAISRGAMLGTFVDRSARMSSVLRRNLASLGIKEGHGEIVEKELLPFLKGADKRRRFWDVVYFDLNDCSEHEQVFKFFERGTTVAPGGTLAIVHTQGLALPERLGLLQRKRTIIQEPSAVTFFERK